MIHVMKNVLLVLEQVIINVQLLNHHISLMILQLSYIAEMDSMVIKQVDNANHVIIIVKHVQDQMIINAHHVKLVNSFTKTNV